MSLVEANDDEFMKRHTRVFSHASKNKNWAPSLFKLNDTLTSSKKTEKFL